VRTLIGAAESPRNGITTIQDFLTVVLQDEAYVDTVLSALRSISGRSFRGIFPKFPMRSPEAAVKITALEGSEIMLVNAA